MRFSSILLTATAVFSSAAVAIPAAELFKRNCPRYDIPVAEDVASIYLGRGTNEGRQVERLIEEVIALLVGEHPKCDPYHVKLVCPGKTDKFGQSKEKRTEQPKTCREDKYPYIGGCRIECATHNYC